MGSLQNGVEKDKRYDRQLRIWGAHGQTRLEACRIALLNCGPTGSETLKNLVLGGIAGFTIVDGAKVADVDLGNNFFVDADSLGEPRARVVTKLLTELNESVAGSYVAEMPETLLQSNPDFFKDFNMVIATQMREEELCKLDEICRESRTQLLIVRSYGLIGYLRPSTQEHQVIESKPDSAVEDLRLHNPFPELSSLAMSFDLDSMDDNTYAHIPFVIILLQARERWMAGGEEGSARGLPTTSRDRTAFKQLLQSMRRVTNGFPIDAENEVEATKAAFQCWTPYAVPSEIRALMADESVNISKDSDTFWIMVASLKAFMEGEGQGCLPLDGSIPDMHSTTDLYLRVQRVYKEKAERDVYAVEAHAHNFLQILGRDCSSIPHETVRLYCKNARNLRVVRYRTLKFDGMDVSSTSAAGSSESRGAGMLQALSAEGSRLADASFGILLQAIDRFYSLHKRYPGTVNHLLEEDVPSLKSITVQILLEHGLSSPSSSIADDYVVEACRFGAGELHVVASLMGGIAAQEAIKLITGQFLPVAGAFIYNGVSATTSVFEWL